MPSRVGVAEEGVGGGEGPSGAALCRVGRGLGGPWAGRGRRARPLPPWPWEPGQAALAGGAGVPSGARPAALGFRWLFSAELRSQPRQRLLLQVLRRAPSAPSFTRAGQSRALESGEGELLRQRKIPGPAQASPAMAPIFGDAVEFEPREVWSTPLGTGEASFRCLRSRRF